MPNPCHAVTPGPLRRVTRQHWHRPLLLALLAGLALAACGPFGVAQPIQTATLGGPQQAFTAQYGQATSGTTTLTSGNTSVAKVEYLYTASVQGMPLRLKISLAKGSDGHQHVSSLGIAPVDLSNSAWDEATARKVVATLIPTDATHVSDFTFVSSPVLPTIVAHVYHSAALAATFPAALFVATDGRRPDPPGSFWVECVPISVPQSTIRSTMCDVGLGETF
jgi:hypothetical protein